ncbi:MAG: Mut7-C RNAse domain-containing protein [Methanotrichaceae archaeon]|nr:Mut7-C RNAse domain-containing protein [Methanotrichaceae archaeon]
MERFIVDHNLMRLGRWLRLLGMNAANPEDADDQRLLSTAKQDQRILITRDRRLADACRSSGADCILILSSKIEDQLAEMAEFGLVLKLNPQRCTICNCILEQDLSGQNESWGCQGCGKVYWIGSHWRKMEKILENIRSSNFSH